MREYEEGYPVDANDRYYQADYPDPERRNSSNFGFAGVKRNAVPGGNKAREDATDYLNEKLKVLPYESTEVLFDQRVEFEGGDWAQSELLPISAGDTVSVTYDGEEYECVAVDVSAMIPGAVMIGNERDVTGEDTGEPFIILIAQGMGTVISLPYGDGSVTHPIQIKIEKSVIHTIDPKFLSGVLLYADDSGCLYKSDVLSEENAVSMDEVLGYAKKGMTVVVTPYTLIERTNYYYATSIIKITYENPNYAQVVVGGDSYYYSKERVVSDPSPV